AMGDGIAAYIAAQHFEKRARLDRVLPEVRDKIAVSRVLTVVFIYDGTETMQGTGFDKDINDLQKEFGRDMRAANLPFVTVLAAHDGKVIEYTVNTPTSVTIPKTAQYFPPPVTNAPAIAVAPKVTNAPPPKPEPRHFEIILTGPKQTNASTNIAAV